ncbi:MAG: type IV pilus modification protein PilV [Gallionella sp.]|nr:type IV pilus modification protein PilV [Gallionella sp.]
MTVRQKNVGFSMVEILVTILILMIGLLGLAGLQGRAMTSQMESYQRSQALILLKDMGDRINANRTNAAAYVTGASPRGTGFNGSAVLSCAGLTGSALDLCEWHNALLGAVETLGGAKVGAMIGARGCIYQTVVPSAGMPGEYLIAIAWQGFNSTAALTVGPAAACGTGQYGGDAKRRIVTLPITIAILN